MLSLTNPLDHPVLAAARAYVKAGICPIPIAADDSPSFHSLAEMMDAIRGGYYQTCTDFLDRLPTDSDLVRWFGTWNSSSPGRIGVLCGQASGGLEALVMSNNGHHGRWWYCTRTAEARALIARPVTLLVNHHVYMFYRVAQDNGNYAIEPTQKLTEQYWGKTTILAEVRGEGCIAAIPPLPKSLTDLDHNWLQTSGPPPVLPPCHSIDRSSRFLDHRDLTAVPTLTVAERRWLLGEAGVLGRDAPRVSLPRDSRESPSIESERRLQVRHLPEPERCARINRALCGMSLHRISDFHRTAIA